MAYVGVEFSEKDTIGLVHCSWFTPLKHEVFWPPYKSSATFLKALTSAEEPDQSTWKLSHVKRKFFECDDIKKAQKKLKKCELSSDIQSSDFSDFPSNENKKRKRLSTKRWSSASSSDSEISEHRLDIKGKSIKLPRPSGLPRLRKPDPLLPLPGSSSTIDRSMPEQFGQTEVTENTEATNNIRITSTAPPAGTPVGNVSVNTNLEAIFKEVRKLREEVKEVKSILKQSRSLSTSSVPNDIPVILPLKDSENFQVLEEYLNSSDKQNDLASYLASFGGTGITGLVNRILRALLSNKLATGFNFAGQRSQTSNKKAFGTTNLNLTIIRAVQVKFAAATQCDIEHAIKVWLKHAKQRMLKTPAAATQHI